MGINLSGLIGPLVNAGTQAAGEYQHAQANAGQQQIGAVLQSIAMQRQQQQDLLKTLLAKSTMDKNTAQGGLATARANALANPQKKLTPHAFMADGQPVMGFADQNGNLYDAQHQPVTGKVTPFVAPEKKAESEIPGTPAWQAAQKARIQLENQYGYHPSSGQVLPGVNGAPAQLVGTGGAAFGSVRDLPTVNKAAPGGSGSAPMAAKAGQFGEMLKKTPDLFKAMEGLDVGYQSSAAKDIAAHGIGIGGLRIPGTQGVGNQMMNNSPQYATYQAALTPWVLAGAHAMSGARINQDQANMIKQSVERSMGDAPTVREMKSKNIIDQLNSIAGSLPADQVAAQEAQMDPAILSDLRARGYRGGGSHSTAAPRPAAPRAPTAKAPSGRDYGIFGKPSPEDEE